MTDPTLMRAAGILRRNHYLSLAVVDEEGPWAAALQYHLLSGRGLSFESAADSRHGNAVVTDRRVAGVIVDVDAATDGRADGLQLGGLCRRIPRQRSALAEVLARRSDVIDLDAAVTELLRAPGRHLFEVTVQRLFVFDPEAWETEGVDRRIDVPVDAVFAGV